MDSPPQAPHLDGGHRHDTIDHLRRIAGIEAIGIGSDFDGIECAPVGLEDVSKLSIITEELLRRGHSESEVRGVLGENFLKFWERAEAARASVPAPSGPLPFSKP